MYLIDLQGWGAVLARGQGREARHQISFGVREGGKAMFAPTWWEGVIPSAVITW